uniref:Chitin-binding type-2 domain-containing protein n=1 Tax=Panagrolaimus sp. JU765 TaxID=591449 RepID=A0AC34RD15_9BILA
MDHDKLIWLLIFLWIKSGNFLAIDLLDANQLEPIEHNYCNDTELMTEAGLVKTPLGQFLGYSCSAEFYHCRWQSDGFRTYRKACKTGLVFDTLGTQNCNFDFNIKGCGLRSDGTLQCKAEEFSCPLSEACVGLAQRCDGTYDCILEEDEQNCPMCSSEEFPCIVSEQCIPSSGRCNGVKECNDGTDEMNCEECGAGYFHCLKSNQCIPIKQRCDGVPQCIHGDDELLCKVVNERFYICENRLDQVPIAQVCDGVENCPDGSDEKYCNQAIVAPHPNGVYPIANNAFMELMNQAVGTPQQFSSIPEEQSEDDEESEAETQQEDDELPEKPLLPIARFTLPPPPLTTTTRRPTTSTTKKPKQIHSTVAFEVQKKHPFMPPRSSNHSRSSVSVVAVTAPPINRGKSVESITITTAAPKTNNDEAEQVFQVTRKALANAAESIDELDQELIKKLGARFSNNGQFSPK